MRFFISYRRNDAYWPAHKIKDHLVNLTSSEDVFIDVDSIPAGVEFTEHIQQAISDCDVLIAVIGPSWLSQIDEENGRRRIDDDSDLVRLEIELALNAGIKVVPVLVDGASMPKNSELPSTLRPLTMRNGETLNKLSFEADLERLFSKLNLKRRFRFLGVAIAVSALLGVVAVATGVYRGSAMNTERPSQLVATSHQDEELSSSDITVLSEELFREGFLASADIDQDISKIEAAVEGVRRASHYSAPTIDLYNLQTDQVSQFVQFLKGEFSHKTLKPKPVQGTLAGFGFFRDCESCPEMVVLPSGRFKFGSPVSEIVRESDEAPSIETLVNYSFAVSIHETTIAQFAEFVRSTGYKPPSRCRISDGYDKWSWVDDIGFSDSRVALSQNHPVTCVDWITAREYVAWLTQTTGARYRLLTEIEWEYAAKGGVSDSQSIPSGARSPCEFANFADASTGYKWRDTTCTDGYPKTAPVGSLHPNAFGLYDMQGNVWEWVEDCYDSQLAPEDRPFSKGNVTDCSTGVSKGGSWSSYASRIRIAKRNSYSRSYASDVHGFRVARDLETN